MEARFQPATKPLPPVIKWSGSKRKMAPSLAELFPTANRYFEPFLGGGAMLPFRPAHLGVAGDIIPEVVALWVLIRDCPEEVASEYEARWARLQREGHTAYYDIRDSFNASRSPHDLMFLSRTCVNGLIRFSMAGDFNNSLHHTRPGIHPDRLKEVLVSWSRVLDGMELVSQDYRTTLLDVAEADFVFLDPPYAGTRGRYHPRGFDAKPLWDELRRLNRIGARWMLTFDGSAGQRSYEADVPEDLYLVRRALGSGHSPFTRLMRTGLDEVTESVFLNYDPAAEAFR